MKTPGNVPTLDLDIEEAAAESAQDVRDHAQLKADHERLLRREDVERVLAVVLRLVDGGIAPAIVAKTMLIGDRSGSAIYQLSVMTPAVGEAEAVTCIALANAIRDVDPVIAATVLIAGSVWLAEQSGITRAQLVDVIGSDLIRRPLRHDRVGAGAIDLVDNDGLGNREWLVDAIGKAQLPMFAPLEFDMKAVRR